MMLKQIVISDINTDNDIKKDNGIKTDSDIKTDENILVFFQRCARAQILQFMTE